MATLTWSRYRKSLAGDIVRLWNRALGEQFPLSIRLFRQNVEEGPSYDPEDGAVVMNGDEVVGYALTERFRAKDPLQETYKTTGWLEAVVVDPAYQRQGVGCSLLDWATARLHSQGAAKILVGGGRHRFFPGVPAELPGVQDYFSRAGFRVSQTVYDVRGNLRHFAAPPSARAALAAVGGDVRPCRTEDIPALMDFLQAEFPGGWRFDTRFFLDQGYDPAEVIIMTQGAHVIGFAHIWSWRSRFLGPSVYWKKLLGHRCGGLGPIGVAQGMRGKGLGLALLQLALQYDAELGVEDGIIDWTTLTGFYALAGFTPWKTYIRMEC